jgi:hypothetical protein
LTDAAVDCVEYGGSHRQAAVRMFLWPMAKNVQHASVDLPRSG